LGEFLLRSIFGVGATDEDVSIMKRERFPIVTADDDDLFVFKIWTREHEIYQ
jgi:hypothetical protein